MSSEVHVVIVGGGAAGLAAAKAAASHSLSFVVLDASLFLAGLFVHVFTVTFFAGNERRLTRPMKRVGPKGSGRMEPIAWEQALDEVAAKLVELRDRHGPETLALFSGTRSGIITNNGYVRLFQQMWGTPNQESTEPFCSSTKNLAFAMVQGDRALPNSYTPTDIGSAGLFVYFGDNQAETGPVYFDMISEWRRRTGAAMVVIDPRLS